MDGFVPPIGDAPPPAGQEFGAGIPGQIPPEVLATLPHDDRGPIVVASVWVMIGFATAFLGLRLYGKYVGRRGLWWDDYTLIASWAILMVDGAIATNLVRVFGLGKHSWDFMPFSIDAFILEINMRTTITITAIAWTKTAFAVTLLRLSKGWMTHLLWFIIVSVNMSMAVNAIMPWVSCTPLAKSWTPSLPGTCLAPNIFVHYSIFASAYSAAADFVLAFLPWALVLGLQMRRHEKIGVAVCMSLGVLAGITAIAKTANLPKLQSTDIYDLVDVILLDIAEPCVTIVAICIPILRTMFPQLMPSRFTTRGRATRDSGPNNNISRLTVPTAFMTPSKRVDRYAVTTSESWNEDVESRAPSQGRQELAEWPLGK